MWYIILIVGLLLGIFLTLIMSWVFLLYQKNQILNTIISALAQFCDNINPITYTSAVYVPNNIYEKELARSLLDISLNTSMLNCTDIPNPPNMDNYLKLKGRDPNTGELTFYGIIYWNNFQAIISFTGTTTPELLASDFQYQQVEANQLNNYLYGIKVHRGFYNIYLSIRHQLWLWRKRYNIPIVFITGHSLGGALSTLCAFDFNNVNPIHYSFASPRVGNREFANKFNKLLPYSCSIVNTCDIVPQLPPAVWQDYIFKEVGNYIPFTIALDTLRENHIDAYQYFVER